MLVEDDRLHVRLIDDGVDDDEVGVGEFGATVPSAVPHEKPAMTIGLSPWRGEAAERLLALGVVLELEIDVGAAGLGLPAPRRR